MNRFFTLATTLLVGASLVFAQAKQPTPKSAKEGQALQALFGPDLSPEARIKAVDDFLAQFADTEFKGPVLQVGAMAAQQANDYDKMMIYSERTLEADPNNVGAMLMIAGGLAQKTREHDLDKEEKLTRAEKFANTAMANVKTMVKPNPQLTDAQWDGFKSDMSASGHEALGMIAMVRKKYDVAATNFKSAVEMAQQPDPANMVRLAVAYNGLNKPDEAIAVLDKVNASPQLHPAVKGAADAERQRAMAMKKTGTPAAKPAAAAPAGTTGAVAPVAVTPATGATSGTSTTTPSSTPAAPKPAPTK